MKSNIKEDGLIFNVLTVQFLVTCYSMIMRTLLRFFILYLFKMPFLSYCNTWGLLKANKKSSIYMIIMKVALFLLDMKILRLAFSGLKFRVLRNLMTFWFYNQLNCFKP